MMFEVDLLAAEAMRNTSSALTSPRSVLLEINESMLIEWGNIVEINIILCAILFSIFQNY